MFRALTIFLLLYSPFLLGQREVLTDFDLRLTNPTGFIAPGESVQIFLELGNPANSDSVLESVSGGGYSLGTYPPQPGPGSVPIQDLAASFQRSALCPNGSTSTCLHEGSFPVNPGESIIFAYDVLQPSLSLPPGFVLAKNRIRLSATVDGEEYSIYSRNNLVYILSEDGTGDESAFDEYQIELPPIVMPSLEVSYVYPETLAAGSHFSLLANVKNTGAKLVNTPGLVFPSPLGTVDPELYLFEACSASCYLSENFSLAPGESTILDIGKFYYSAPMLESEALAIDSIRFNVSDEFGRQLVITPAADAIQIEIEGPADGPKHNPALDVPVRALPELRDLEQAGDQLLLHDPNTGFDWIRLHASAGYTQGEIESALASNPLLAGYAIARRRQVEQLVSNYLHARGLAHINLHAALEADDINDALYDFIALIGKNSGGGFATSSVSTAGVIVDLPGLHPQFPDRVSIMQIRADEPGGFIGSFPRGVMQSNRELMPSNTFMTTGFWLVKATSGGSTWLPAGRSYFVNDELVIPMINIDDEWYSARMNFRSSIDEILQLTALSELESGTHNATAQFDLDSGILEIPLLRIVTSTPGVGEDYVVTLNHLPDTVPPLFLIESAQPAEQE